MYRKGLLAAAAIALLCGTAAMAQTATTPGTGGNSQTLADSGSAPARSWHRHFVHMGDPDFAKKMCVEHFARSTGRLAYLEAKLQLTADQQPLWDKWEQTVGKSNATMRDDCLANVPAKDTSSTVLDRDSRLEKLLSDKLDALKAARPSLEALYQSLSPEQRTAFDRSAGHRSWKGGSRGNWHRPGGDEKAPI